MNDAFRMAATGMSVIARMMDNAASNAANARTPGYLSRQTITRSFQTALDRELGRAPSLLESLDRTSFRQGNVVPSDNPLHVALMGPGFLQLRGPGQDLYTRNGSLTLAPDGTLVTQAGYAVLGRTGPIRGDRSSGAQIEIKEGGAVYQNNIQIGRLRVVEFKDRDQLKRMGETMFAAGQKAGAHAATETHIVPRHLELPPEQSIVAMVQMIEAGRSFETQQRVVRTLSQSYDNLLRQN